MLDPQKQQCYIWVDHDDDGDGGDGGDDGKKSIKGLKDLNISKKECQIKFSKGIHISERLGTER